MFQPEEADPEASQGREEEEVKTTLHSSLYIHSRVVTFTKHQASLSSHARRISYNDDGRAVIVANDPAVWQVEHCLG
jgi:hypothetical protein